MALLVGIASCGSDDLLGPDAPQGVEGIVLIGPQCPVQSVDDPCPDLPYRAWISVQRRDGSVVTRLRSDDDGRFRVGLRAGAYVIAPESGDPFPSASPQDVDVREGAYTQVTVSFDTGIR